MPANTVRFLLFAFIILVVARSTQASPLSESLLNTSAEELATEAKEFGNPQRGAILFHQVHIGCIKCHAVDGSANGLGPNLTELLKSEGTSDSEIVSSVLKPSEKIRKGFETYTVQTTSGKVITGLLLEKSDEAITLRDPGQAGLKLTIPVSEIEEGRFQTVSIMPTGIVDQLGSRQQFRDLIRYLLEIRDGGLARARELQPAPGLITLTVPEYENHIDHAQLIQSLDDDAFNRGEQIYLRLCINCHGNLDHPGSLPTALRFAEGKFKNGSDPYSMYRTLTYGAGLMVPQTWMVPRQKYDVIHYLREVYLKERNPSQYTKIDNSYLATLPSGDTLGPEPVEYSPWSNMDYGPAMVNTFEIGNDGENFAQKGVAIRLDSGPGGVAKGNRWAIFDHDTMRIAAVWDRDPESKDPGFINWHGIHFDGRHGTHPRIVGRLQIENPTGPGWANPTTGEFDDDQRVTGRDGRQYGPLPRDWADFNGLHVIGDQTVIDYSIDQTRILEVLQSTGMASPENHSSDLFSRQLHIAPHSRALTNLIATHESDSVQSVSLNPTTVALIPDAVAQSSLSASQFDGQSAYLLDQPERFDTYNKDFSIAAKIRTTSDGTIFSRAPESGPWVPNGTSFFIRNGRLTYDIGWVGAVNSRTRIVDGKWHTVAMTWQHETGEVHFFVDGHPSGSGVLKPKESAEQLAAKIGFTSKNFPSTSSFQGEIQQLDFHSKALATPNLVALTSGDAQSKNNLVASFPFADSKLDDEGQLLGINEATRITKHSGNSDNQPKAILAGILGDVEGCRLHSVGNRILLTLSAREQSRNLLIWTMTLDSDETPEEMRAVSEQLADLIAVESIPDLLSQPRPQRWSEIVETVATTSPPSEGFQIDTIAVPKSNPWFCRIRLSGHDFFSDGDTAAVSSWDGDVWRVSGLSSIGNGDPNTQGKLSWQRIASGLFQPLGVKIVDDVVYVTCRDQIVILRDENGDGETDFYECFNQDHQVTEHFHEFAMGLQRDEQGNFYYAKSARHALKAVVPHHGTLLKVSPDGEKTEIIANGFRAANGVCLNPDGSFIVTDQEGHWNPKNRINWVTPGGFYGNMFGYHDVTDDSDDAMIPPLCWITNSFDRSPAELLWVDSPEWKNLNGTLLNLSYGYGKIYVVPHEQIGDQRQGGMCELPIPQFPTGVCRGRFHSDGSLYLTGLFAWASQQQSEEGGFYRVRKVAGQSMLPIGLNAKEGRMIITWTDPIHPDTCKDVERFEVTTWDLKRTARYGSDHYNVKSLPVESVQLSEDQRRLELKIPELAPTWGMEIRCRLLLEDGSEVQRVIHNTIHVLGKD
ncbi:Laminin G domain protein [Thalassoglobus neptunius]|uniref:Laminin G domain protein n=1 Tax=Thalassoglobus neptunius TaxID=1938619 RepID=A0A5C5WY67_9PLAN|nr:DUF6797 domain-containing protein [Thalassoglobus neptunius]TWT55626.1 Laminin G domain protein [Thalassoglobus neptunius]